MNEFEMKVSESWILD